MLSYNSQEFERAGPGRIRRAKKEGYYSCEKKLQVNVNIGLLVVLGWGSGWEQRGNSSEMTSWTEYSRLLVLLYSPWKPR